MSQKLLVKRKRRTDSEKRQFITHKYFINEGEGKRSVCLQFLCNTLDVSQIYYTVSNASFGSAKEDLRGKSIPPNKTKECTKLAVINFIKSLPAVPSHYCRKNSSRLYLPQDFKNLTKLYQIYKKKNVLQGIDVVGERIFRNIFQENFNIGFHVPKKDKCLQCIRFERLDMDIADEAIKQAKLDHVEEKNHSYNRFKMHQNIQKTDPATLCKKDVHKITIKNSMNEKASSFKIEVQMRLKATPTSCYKSLLPISKQKYDDLNKLCINNVIPPIFHHEFMNIPTATVKDTLPDSDIEDEFE
ncbi:unnamed protein product [Psylliodes chrysocephalus]|uniref:Uncharacterized protein n=1 Tax=Psylliodes chrysocephalus TaxID=3402493 RepID=A0A9P0CWB9_9CUCU|nr:unnamed protein product [Psylliodes chrysocephala]